MTYEEFLGVPELNLFQMAVIFDITNLPTGQAVKDYLDSYPDNVRAEVYTIAELVMLAQIDYVEDCTQAKKELDRIFKV